MVRYKNNVPKHQSRQKVWVQMHRIASGKFSQDSSSSYSFPSSWSSSASSSTGSQLQVYRSKQCNKSNKSVNRRKARFNIGKAQRNGAQDQTQARMPGERLKPGVAALREIARYQKITRLLIPRAPFSRLIKQILGQFRPEFRMQTSALEAIQEAVEAYIVTYFEDADILRQHGKRATLMPRDFQTLARLKNRWGC